MNTKIEQRENSLIEIEGVLTSEEFEAFRKPVLKKLSETVSIDGFRKGAVPEKILVNHVGEMHILEEMAQRALEEYYPKIIIDNNIDAIGRPDISITKLAPGNPLEFKIKQAIMPKFELPDVEKIAKEVMGTKEEDTEATDEDITKVLEDLQKHKTPEGGEAPTLDDAFAQSLGNFESLDTLKGKLKENIKMEKQMRAKDKKRIELMERLIENTKIDIPEILIERETTNLLEDVRARIEARGKRFADYLDEVKRTEADLRKEFREDAKKRSAYGLILGAIATKFNIDVPREDLDRETERVLSYYQGADPHAARHYAEGVLKNERTFSYLENLGK